MTVFIVHVDQSYASYVSEPEAAFTTRGLAEAYCAAHVVPTDTVITEIPLDP